MLTIISGLKINYLRVLIPDQCTNSALGGFVDTRVIQKAFIALLRLNADKWQKVAIILRNIIIMQLLLKTYES
jgi:hypothetical protein